MLRSIIIISLLTLCLSACGAPVPQPEPATQPAPKWTDVAPVASYDIQVTLDDENKTLTGQERITYVNTSETPITDAVLNLYLNIMERPAVYPKMIEKHVRAELPFMATENILMACVKKGGDRQALHEVIRKHSQAAAAVVKQEGGENDLLDRLSADKAIGMSRAEIEKTLDLRECVGRAPEQCGEFCAEFVDPVLKRHAAKLGLGSDVRV